MVQTEHNQRPVTKMLRFLISDASVADDKSAHVCLFTFNVDHLDDAGRLRRSHPGAAGLNSAEPIHRATDC
jgi:hypothetical protein